MPLFTATVAWRDEDGHVSTSSFKLDKTTLADASSALELIVEAMDVLTNAAFAGASLTATVDTSGWTVSGTAAVGSDVEIGGRFIFRTSGIRYFTTITVPGFLKDLYAEVGGIISPLVTEVAAFITSVTGNDVTTSHGENITSFHDGYEVFNGKR